MSSRPIKYSRLGKQSHMDVSGQMPIRYVIVSMVVLSCTVDYITRVNINVAIVSMVSAHPHSHNLSAGACPFEEPANASNITQPHHVYHNLNTNLTYDWSPTTQVISFQDKTIIQCFKSLKFSLKVNLKIRLPREKKELKTPL